MTLLCEHSHDRRAGLSGKALASSLESARRLCAARGERLTRPRERVLELLLQASGPLKAYDLLAGMSVADGRAAPPTVYRALDFLASQGLAHRI
ncbi:MAG: transcriptional repressor, partial [Alphaproteobacteria bacterium]